jgi:hypothetical protein
MIGRRAPTRVVVDRVVVRGVPAPGLDPVAVSAAVREVLPALVAESLTASGSAGRSRPVARGDVGAVRVGWWPAAGTDALSKAVADGVVGAIGGRYE